MVIAATVIVVGSGAWYAWGYFSAKGSMAAVDAAMTSVQTTPTPQAVDADPAQMTPDTFMQNLTRVEQMDYAGTKLNQNVEAQTVALNRELERMGWGDYNYFNRPVVEPVVTNTPQEIWDQITLAEYTAWKTAQAGDLNEAKKLASAIAEGKEYDELVALFANGGGPVLPVGVGMDAKPVITTGSYGGHEANGLGLTEFRKIKAITGDEVNVVVRFTEGTSPDSKRWVLVGTN